MKPLTPAVICGSLTVIISSYRVTWKCDIRNLKEYPILIKLGTELNPIIIFFSTLQKISCDDIIVNVAQGQLRGEHLTTVTGKSTYYSFKGIPYAKPPVGSLRFKVNKYQFYYHWNIITNSWLANIIHYIPNFLRVSENMLSRCPGCHSAVVSGSQCLKLTTSLTRGSYCQVRRNSSNETTRTWQG